MWYKWAQEQVKEWEIPPDQWGISRKQVDDMLTRLKGASGIHYRERGEKWEDLSDDTLALEAANNFEIYHRYLSKLPEEISVYDLLRAYRAGLLPYTVAPPPRTPPLDISGAKEVDHQGLPWEPQKYDALEKDELEKLLEVAKMRVTQTNRDMVENARHQIFLASFKDPEILDKLGMKQSELNKMLRGWSNMPAKSIVLEQRINQEPANLTTEWSGISNSSYLSQIDISHQDIDGFFKDITINPDIAEWYQQQGEPLRKYILRTALAIDTHIKYDDLSFEIVDAIVENYRGLYESRRKTIQIRENHPHTVAHEIGHHLDFKWAEDLTGMNSALSDATFNIDVVFGDDEEAKQFYRFFQEFVMDISERSELSSEYYQRRHEVFARFIAKFVDWVNKKAGSWAWGESHYTDNFTEYDYIKFIKILQMKSYLDSREK